jgi:predicted HTH transcriptional regulator
MSIVTSFANSCATTAFSMIGSETVTISGTDFSCILAEAETQKEFAEGGFEVIKSLTATCKLADLPSGDLVKKQATARSQTWRVDDVSKGQLFATLRLSQATRA